MKIQYKRCPVCDKPVIATGENCSYCGHKFEKKIEPELSGPSKSGVAMSAIRPLTAMVGLVLCTFGGVIYLALISWLFIIMLAAQEYNILMDPMVIYPYAYDTITGIVIIVGAIFINRGRYRIGGAISFITSITYFAFNYTGTNDFRLFILTFSPIVGGILGIISNEDITSLIMGLMMIYGNLKISDLTARLGKTEVDVELVINEMLSKGMPIRFYAETRELIYQEVPSAFKGIRLNEKNKNREVR